MIDELEEIKKAMKETPPPQPGENAKKFAIEKAMEAFDQNQKPVRQGTGWLNRLTDRIQILIGGLSMKKTFVYASVVCLALILLVGLYIPSLRSAREQAKNLPMYDASVAQKSRETTVGEVKSLAQADRTLETREGSQPTFLLGNTRAETKGTEVSGSTASLESAPLPDLAQVSPPPSPKTPEAFFSVPPAITPAKPVTSPPVAAQSQITPEQAILQAGGYSQFASKEEFRRGAGGKASGGVPNVDGVPLIGRFFRSESQTQPYEDSGRDRFQDFKQNPIHITREAPVSTFSIDVDTASYSFLRASIQRNTLPPVDAVRVEELINYFPYNYEVPESKSEPFKTSVSVFPAPWNKDTKLIHIGIKGYELKGKEKPRSNLVFLIDTSGSMRPANKLPLVQNSMKLLLDSLRPDDTVAIVTYAGNAGIALEPTPVKNKQEIVDVLNDLHAGGSTAGAAGIKEAYKLAQKNFNEEGVNRVILATDGDFNVGITDHEELKNYIEGKRKTGIFLSVLGFGMGNYNDALMQTLAQNGNGTASYIDNLNEARKVMVEEASSTLFTIAKDVKIQVEFNPEKVAEYRLIGYETRLLKREDFNNDKVDAGDIGAGHTVTAIYEITPGESKARMADSLRYQKETPPPSAAPSKDHSNEYAFLKIRYKLPDSDSSNLITTPIDEKLESREIGKISEEARFATAVAAYGQLLRGDASLKSFTYDNVIKLAESSKGEDPFGYRSEFISLIRLTKNAPGSNSSREE